MIVPDLGRGVDTPASPGRPPDGLTTAPPDVLTYVTFQSRTATRPIEHSATWAQLADRLTQHARRPDKDGPGWSPAVYKRGKDGALLTRANDSVQELTCAVADVDHVELDDVVQLREHLREQGLACVIYSTHSSTETEPRVRVVIPFAEPVPADLWPRLWPALNERLFLGLADRAASDPSRLYYLPAAPPDALTIGECWDGAALDWHPLPLAEAQAPSTPAATIGTGSAENVAPEDMPILERLFSGRRGEQRMRAWTGDYSDFSGNASSADQSIANGLVTYCRGDVERAERIMRAGAWRPKWDGRRGSTTWLGLTLGKALAAYRAWAGKQDEPETAEETPPAGETCEQQVLRLERELAQERQAHAQTRSVNAAQQTVIRAQRARLDVLEPYVADIQDVLGRDEAECPSDDKVVLIGLVPWLQTYRAEQLANGESPAFHLKYGAKVVGMEPKRFSKVLGRWSSPDPNDGAPWYKHVTRTLVTDDDGLPAWESALTVTPWRETPREILRASLAYVPTVLPKRRGGSEEATAHRWGRCTKHPSAMVDLQGRCSVGGEVLGTVRVSPDDFEALKSRFVLSETTLTPPVGVLNLSTAQNGISDGRPGPNGLKVQIVDSGSRPLSLLEYAATRGVDPPPERCPAPGCRAMQFRQLPDGAWRCLKSAHDPRTYQLVPMMAGGEE